MADGDTPDAPLFAFYRSKQRKEPMTDARHVRDVAARFDQVIDVSDADRTLAFANIQKAARYTSSRSAQAVRSYMSCGTGSPGR